MSSAAIATFLLLSGCQREERELRLDPPIASALDHVKVMPSGVGGAPPKIHAALDRT
jgi:cytochrome c oxidase cbb3-type subunit 3